MKQLIMILIFVNVAGFLPADEGRVHVSVQIEIAGKSKLFRGDLDKNVYDELLKDGVRISFVKLSNVYWYDENRNAVKYTEYKDEKTGKDALFDDEMLIQTSKIVIINKARKQQLEKVESNEKALP